VRFDVGASSGVDCVNLRSVHLIRESLIVFVIVWGLCLLLCGCCVCYCVGFAFVIVIFVWLLKFNNIV